MEEEDEIQAQQQVKFPRLANNNNNKNKSIILPKEGGSATTNRLHGWHHSSRIIRVSRASGGKDRHSKVMTSKGLRDRRVRLSVTTAIQFYDLQDRLGYDQPSKAVEWLIKSAADAISDLPSLNATFPPETPNHPSDDGNNIHSQISSNSETSKGSGVLSLSRSDSRVKARERARERASKDQIKKKDSHPPNYHTAANPVSQTASFTELLTGGIPTTAAAASPRQQQQQPQWGSAPMDYLSTVFLGPSSSSRAHQSQIQFAEAMSFNVGGGGGGDNHQNQQQHQSDQMQLQQQHFSFIPDQFTANSHHNNNNNEYNLNFTMSSSSSGLAGFNNNNRGTLQSNSQSHLLPHHLQRFSLPMDGSSSSSSTVPFFIGAAPVAAAAPVMESHHQNHHQFSPVFDGRLQLSYGDGSRHSDHKGKSKN